MSPYFLILVLEIFLFYNGFYFLKAGTIEINAVIHWLQYNPFGGYKHSGIGREHRVIVLRELCQIKLISEEK